VKINELDGGIIYIEDAFPLHKEFIDAIENNNKNEKINGIIPSWVDWMDGGSIDGVWTPTHHRGYVKQIDWDYSINSKNSKWPRIEIGPYHSSEHFDAYNILKMIDEPCKEILDIWHKKTGNKKLEWITKNYTIKKYKTNQLIRRHRDRDHDQERNTYDWTVLIYLNDDYTGGEIVFSNLGLTLTPKAGSVLFFSSDEVHEAKKVLSGNKYFIFFYIHSEHGICHSSYENFYDLIQEKQGNFKKEDYNPGSYTSLYTP
jgi:hypothetical protein